MLIKSGQFILLRLTRRIRLHLPMMIGYCYLACLDDAKFLFNEDEQFISINTMYKLVVIL